MAGDGEWIRVRGARVHNLHNVDVDLPRDRLSVLTGPSGSGKSSLAFDTLYAEGQRRYLETLRVDTRALFDQLQRPDVDLVEGLPPTLCVAQQTGSARPRSTLATITEIHDHFRLLWARLGTLHCRQCGQPVQRQTVTEIARQTLALEEGRKVYVLAPLVRGRKGEHKDVFQQIRQGGFLRARLNRVLTEIRDTPRLKPGETHTIELVVDRLVIRPNIEERLTESLNTAVKHSDGTVIVTQIDDGDDGDWHDRLYSTRFACARCDISFAEPEPRRFSFNNPYGACPVCNGLGQVWEFDPALIVPDMSWSVTRVLDRLRDSLPPETALPLPDNRQLVALLKLHGGAEGKACTLKTPLADWPAEAFKALVHGSDVMQPALVGLLPALRKRFEERGDDEDGKDIEEGLKAFAGYLPCPDCAGARLNREARAMRFAGKGIHEVTALTVDDAAAFFETLDEPEALAPGATLGPAGADASGSSEQRIGAVILGEILNRLHFLQEVGLGYLTLDRRAPTLSGGEAQRARLATHLGGGLLGVCYILDEPTIGLHPRDTQRLLAALRGLQQRGNTVIVVEHDEAVIREADYLVDMGPGAGRHGGHVLAAGPVDDVLANPASVTGPFLRASVPPPNPDEPEALAPGEAPCSPVANASGSSELTIRGARHHNLKNIDVTIPLGRMVCVTGVSGSGKSTLVHDILCSVVRRRLGLAAPAPGQHDGIDGLEHIDKIIEVEQTPLGRSSRSSAATYTGVYDEIRKVFAATRPAKLRGYKANRFSFNVKGGRCDECQGQGVLRVALQFLPDLTVPCPQCRGKRFNRATLEVLYHGRSSADVLDMPVAEAVEFFRNIPNVHRPLEALADVGLGYLTLGQPASALSGGEAQRVKLAAELARTVTGRTLFLLDEPTTGLHFSDVANLLRVLRKLVAGGNTMVIIEHHLDVIRAADWIVDLGPEGGAAGGHLVAAGTPADIAACRASVTGRFLRTEQM